MNAELVRYGIKFTQKFPGVMFSKEILQKGFSKRLTYYFEYRQKENRMCHQTKDHELQNQCSQKDLV